MSRNVDKDVAAWPDAGKRFQVELRHRWRFVVTDANASVDHTTGVS